MFEFPSTLSCPKLLLLLFAHIFAIFIRFSKYGTIFYCQTKLYFGGGAGGDCYHPFFSLLILGVSYNAVHSVLSLRTNDIMRETSL